MSAAYIQFISELRRLAGSRPIFSQSSSEWPGKFSNPFHNTFCTELLKLIPRHTKNRWGTIHSAENQLGASLSFINTNMRNTLLSSSISLLLLTATCTNYEYGGIAETAYEPDPVVAGDQYTSFTENPFVETTREAVSTFSIDTDGASYANVRRFLLQDAQIPPQAAIRTEELINYFNVHYPYQASPHPITLSGEVSACPWNQSNRLVRIGIQGRPLVEPALPPSNYVFLIDVSGSMADEDKLGLLKSGFKQLVDSLQAEDRVAIVTYAGSAGVALPSTTGNEKDRIKRALNRLGSGGSTAGAQGILTAYDIARTHFIKGGNNRIILGTDGDFNVGPASQKELVDLIEEQRTSGIFLTVLGVGRGNLNDATLEQLANHGNGNYEYIDHVEQLKKVFLYEYSKFFTVAKDVKVQATFNPDYVESYRLIGYENRVLQPEDFEDDREDAGDIAAGQNVTALYEIIPTELDSRGEAPILHVDFRYKLPEANESILLQRYIRDSGKSFEAASDFTRFTASVAAFSMLLRDSEYKGTSSYASISGWLADTDLPDPYGFKSEFKYLVKRMEEQSESLPDWSAR